MPRRTHPKGGAQQRKRVVPKVRPYRIPKLRHVHARFGKIGGVVALDAEAVKSILHEPIVQPFADGLVKINGQAWAKRRARKAGVCRITGKTFEAGVDVYAPIGNPMNRHERASASAVEGMARQ